MSLNTGQETRNNTSLERSFDELSMQQLGSAGKGSLNSTDNPHGDGSKADSGPSQEGSEQQSWPTGSDKSAQRARYDRIAAKAAKLNEGRAADDGPQPGGRGKGSQGEDEGRLLVRFKLNPRSLPAGRGSSPDKNQVNRSHAEEEEKPKDDGDDWVHVEN